MSFSFFNRDDTQSFGSLEIPGSTIFQISVKTAYAVTRVATGRQDVSRQAHARGRWSLVFFSLLEQGKFDEGSSIVQFHTINFPYAIRLAGAAKINLT